VVSAIHITIGEITAKKIKTKMHNDSLGDFLCIFSSSIILINRIGQGNL
jgi:hypothetical protein